MRQRILKQPNHTLRNLAILGILFSSIILVVYVSIPDYPRDARAWEIMLWGEKSQWWSEMSWILLFDVFSISIMYLASWSRRLPGNPRVDSSQRTFRMIWGISSVLLIYDFSILHFRWHGWYSTFALDSGGWLHGTFYLWVTLLGVLLFGEGLAFVSKVIPRIGPKSQKEY